MAKLPKGVWWIEVRWWYDWIAYYEDKNTWERFSKYAHIPIANDELCKYGKIYKVRHSWEEYDYNFIIVSERDDKDPENPSNTEQSTEPEWGWTMQPTVLTIDAPIQRPPMAGQTLMVQTS